jgi:hypothetical protein
MAVDCPGKPPSEGKHTMSWERLIENLRRLSEAEAGLAQAINEMCLDEEKSEEEESE